MRRLLVCVLVLGGFAAVRKRRLDALDRELRFGPYRDLNPN